MVDREYYISTLITTLCFYVCLQSFILVEWTQFFLSYLQAQ